MYLMWMDKSKRPAIERAAEGVAAYQAKHGRQPREIAVNPAHAEELATFEVPVVVRNEVPRNVFYVGDND